MTSQNSVDYPEVSTTCNASDSIYDISPTRHNPLLSLHNPDNCYNIALSRLYKWYELALSQKNLVLSILKAILANPITKLEGMTSDSYEKIISDITRRVHKSLTESFDKNNIGELLSFDPFYVP